MAAFAILQASRTTPRVIWQGTPILKAILGTLVAPGWMGRLMARQAYAGQLGDEADDAQRPDNLLAPLEGLHRITGASLTGAGSRPRPGVVLCGHLGGVLIIVALLAAVEFDYWLAKVIPEPSSNRQPATRSGRSCA
ncbi:hypothetical protein [Pseudomonas mangiferae]|uniref:Uncharacterized protein n=1 Tax=Pseudomonas mangiferae TaxID=2593654 RepID=A0A553H0S1_9PSED|nr:hypothetical protein [Pseudomonas mangiferae]TRX75344.1 hypothetical protein FM069_06250 [Pseudomonas mangiferae]